MNSPDYLYLLIRSMTKSEKRHFKLYFNSSEMNVDKKYLMLFDLINEMDPYDESFLLKALYFGEKTTKLANDKKHLYSQLLNSLSQYLKNSKDELNIEANLMQYEVLLKKNLIDQAMQILFKTKKICYSTERLNFLPEIIMRQSYLTRITGKYTEFYDDLSLEINKVINDMKIEFSIGDIQYHLKKSDNYNS